VEFIVSENGIAQRVRIISEEIEHVRSAAIGLWVGAGSRDEREGMRNFPLYRAHVF